MSCAVILLTENLILDAINYEISVSCSLNPQLGAVFLNPFLNGVFSLVESMNSPAYRT